MQRVRRSDVVFRYDADTAAVVRVAPGERFVVETRIGFGDNEVRAGQTLEHLDIERCDPLTGPIDVIGAEPGDAIAVSLERIEPVGAAKQGTLGGIGVLERGWTPVQTFEVADGAIEWNGVTIPIEPSLGIVGVAPARGSIPSVRPGDHGGNLDDKYLRAGATVLLPVFHPGARLVLGDCHLLLGDGELGAVSPESDAEVVVRVELLRGAGLRRPRIRFGERLMLLASAPTVEQAARMAAQDMVELLTAETRLSADQAYLLLTMKTDLEISQIVNELVTVRAAIDERFLDELRSAAERR